MTARVFVDTNVLVYQFDNREPEKQARSQVWMDHLWEAHAGLVSFQVLQEFYAIVTRKLRPGHLLTEDLQHDQDLEGLRVANPFRVTPRDLVSKRSY